MNFVRQMKISPCNVLSQTPIVSSILNTNNNLVCYQCVRWSRHKPRWLPVAKTKMYRIPARKEYPEEQTAELLTWFNNYRTQMKALHLYLAEKQKAQETGPEVIAERLRQEELKYVECMQINDEWNASVARSREARLAREAEERRQKIAADIAERERARMEKIRGIEVAVRREKELSKTFITRENIDEAIEKALNERVDFNFCIDLKGNIYKGLRARPDLASDNPSPQKLEAESA
ncbi:probable 28S ribosomal protein S26, mitochondrial [Nilaparvata lugens]|uniref:probable 28S ribosomal protein S26, mitochondrial n=1 Tax=Nilaparvata lugens TaxID=108931 RepID=UPI00193E24B2|nr:probable 28S ribosomal protein S26, mitochondrial [Nilaparvata lugens]